MSGSDKHTDCEVAPVAHAYDLLVQDGRMFVSGHF
jgi:hypothetical protein